MCTAADELQRHLVHVISKPTDANFDGKTPWTAFLKRILVVDRPWIAFGVCQTCACISEQIQPIWAEPCFFPPLNKRSPIWVAKKRVAKIFRIQTLCISENEKDALPRTWCR